MALTREERRAFVRILTDNIKADKVIDTREMEEYEQIKSEYRLSPEDERAAYEMTLGEAVSIIRESSPRVKEDILKIAGVLNDSDGFRPREEALFTLALNLSLVPDDPEERGDVLSYEIDSNWFEPDQVLYVESSHDTAINAAIEQNLRTISAELNLCGFNFVYIPSICRHYVETPRDLVKPVVRMIAPYLDENRTEEILRKIKLYKTDNFCVEQLGYKLGMEEMITTNPSLLFRMNNSRVGNRFIANFLRIPVEREIVDIVCNICDLYLSYHTLDRDVISLRKDHEGRFLFSGFYRQLLEIMLLRRKIVSPVEIDLIHNSISFPEAGVTLPEVVRREKCLFTLFVYETVNGPVSFRAPRSEKKRPAFDARMNLLQKKYNAIYEAFGGKPDGAPLLTNEKARSPMFSRIRKAFEHISEDVHNTDQLIINKNSDNKYQMTVNFERIRIREFAHPEGVPFVESNLFRQLQSLDENS